MADINEKDNVKEVNMSETEHPEWATCIMGKLSFCPKCGNESLLSDGIKMVCTQCDYTKTI